MCCGRKRSALRNISSRDTAQAPPLAPESRDTARSPRRVAVAAPSSGRVPVEPPSVLLRYVEYAPVQVWGPVTGRQYVFSAAQSVRAVDPGDAAVLSGTRFFRRA
jgi:hypothetical protein